MIKKTAVLLCGLFIFSSLGFAAPGRGGSDGETAKKERKTKLESMKNERIQNQNDLDALVEKYNNASDSQKSEVKKEIADLISRQTDQELADRKEFLSAQKKRIEKLENRISEIENDKAGYVNKKTDFIISPKGQSKTKIKN